MVKLREFLNALFFHIALICYLPVYFLTALKSNFSAKFDKTTHLTFGFPSNMFGGNGRMIFDALRADGHRVFRVVFRKSLANTPSPDNLECYYRFDVHRISLFLKTDAWILTHSWGSVPFGQIRMRLGIRLGGYWIDFWHGLGGNNIVGHKSREKFLNRCDLMCVTSEYYRNDYLEVVDNQEKVVITGYARTDSLISGGRDREKILTSLNLPTNRKYIVYAPTWGYDELLLADDKTPEALFKSLNTFCINNNSIFVIRPHTSCSPSVMERLKNIGGIFDNILYLPIEVHSDIIDLLHISDVLVTDWSSVNFDYFLLDKPIIYLDIREPKYGTYQLPEERTGGYHCSTAEDLLTALSESLTHPDLFREERDALFEKLYGTDGMYADGKATERCVWEILRLVEKKP